MGDWARFLNGFLMVALPVGLGAVLAKRLRVSWRLFAIGGTTFLASQLLHIPFNQWGLWPLIHSLGWDLAQEGWGRYGVALMVGLSAGVFEESARYLVLRTWLRSVRDWKRTLMFGAGHGGVEAILLGALALINFFVLLAYRGGDISQLVAPEQLELARLQIEAFWAAPWHLSLLGAVERVFALCFHLAAAVMVVQVFRRGNLLWLLLAIGWHTSLNAAALIALQEWGPYAAEAVLGGLSLISLWILWRLREEGPEPVVESDPPALARIDLAPLERTRDRLEDSRFSD